MPELRNNTVLEKEPLKYFYLVLTDYIALRKALKSGVSRGCASVLKTFRCDCRQHKDLAIKIAVAKELKNFQLGDCHLTAEKTHISLMDKQGKYLLASYKFYISHPNWKVRVAVAVGLEKFSSAQSVRLLARLLKDNHTGVKLAAVQTLANMPLYAAQHFLSTTPAAESDNQLQRFARRAINRAETGISDNKLNKTNLKKIIFGPLARKIHYHYGKVNKLLISTGVLQGPLGLNGRLRYFGHRDKSIKQADPYRTVVYRGRSLLVKQDRHNKKTAGQVKSNYANSLFFKQTLPIDRIENCEQAMPGEIYWAVADRNDRKITRPVLIIAKINKADYLVAPSTSDLSKQSSQNRLIEIEGKKGVVQLHRRKIMHQSLFLNKYGEVEKTELDEITKIVKTLKSMQENFHRSHFHRRPRLSRSFFNTHKEKYFVSEVPENFVPEPKVASMLSKPHPVSEPRKESRRKSKRL